jgi:hypothetical protein
LNADLIKIFSRSRSGVKSLYDQLVSISPTPKLPELRIQIVSISQ